MSDLVDQAQEVEERQRRAALAAHGMRTGAMVPPGDWEIASAQVCEEPRCGAPIPEARRRAVPGVTLCIECQTRIERRGGRRG